MSDRRSKVRVYILFSISLFLLAASFFTSFYTASYNLTFLKGASAKTTTSKTKTYSRKEVQDMIVATAYSYYYNTLYSSYSQSGMDKLDGYYKNPTIFYRDTTVNPEMPSRSNYYHIDCSSFVYNVYRYTIGYDMSEFTNISPTIYFTTDGKFQYIRKLNTKDEQVEKYRYVSNYLGKSWNSSFPYYTVASLVKNCTAYNCVKNTINNVIKKEENYEYNKDLDKVNNELIYLYYSKKYVKNSTEYGESQEAFKLKYQSIFDNLQPGDIIYLSRYKENDTAGHVMLYVGNNKIIHSASGKTNSIKLATIGESNGYLVDLINGYFDNKKNFGARFIAVLRPINTICKNNNCSFDKNENNIELTEKEKENNEARVDLKDIQVEQYMSTINNYINNEKEVTKEMTESKYNSINVGDEITYKLRITNKSKESLVLNEISVSKPKNSTFIESGIEPSTESKIKNTDKIWKVPEIKAGEYKEYYYTVEAKEEAKEKGTLTFNGFKITTNNDNILRMSDLKISVNSTINKDSEERLNEVCNNNLSTIKDVTEISSIKLIKNIYKDAFNVNLNTLSKATFNFKNIKKAIFSENKGAKKNAKTYCKNDNHKNEVFCDNKNNKYINIPAVYTLNKNKKSNIYKMLVPGMYGGKNLKGNPDKERIRYLRGFSDENGIHSDLESGDIILYWSTEEGSWLYLVNKEGKPILVNRYGKKEGDDAKKILNNLFKKELFAILRPSRLGKIVQYNITETEETESKKYITYNKYISLSKKYTLNLNYGEEYNNKILKKDVTVDSKWYLNKKLKSIAKKIVDNVYAKYQKKITLATPKLTGYKFLGWYTKDNKKASNNYVLKSDTTLYAKWQAIKYKIKFNANGGKGSESTQTFTYDKLAKLNKNKFTKEGYEFEGWSITKNGKVKYKDNEEVKNILSKNKSQLTLYAIWKKIPVVTTSKTTTTKATTTTVNKNSCQIRFKNLKKSNNSYVSTKDNEIQMNVKCGSNMTMYQITIRDSNGILRGFNSYSKDIKNINKTIYLSKGKYKIYFYAKSKDTNEIKRILSRTVKVNGEYYSTKFNQKNDSICYIKNYNSTTKEDNSTNIHADIKCEENARIVKVMLVNAKNNKTTTIINNKKLKTYTLDRLVKDTNAYDEYKVRVYYKLKNNKNKLGVYSGINSYVATNESKFSVKCPDNVKQGDKFICWVSSKFKNATINFYNDGKQVKETLKRNGRVSGIKSGNVNKYEVKSKYKSQSSNKIVNIKKTNEKPKVSLYCSNQYIISANKRFFCLSLIDGVTIKIDDNDKQNCGIVKTRNNVETLNLNDRSIVTSFGKTNLNSNNYAVYFKCQNAQNSVKITAHKDGYEDMSYNIKIVK